MSENQAPEPATAPSLRSRILRLRRPVGFAAAAALTLGTIYLTVMTVLWQTHTSSLQADAIALRDDLVASEAQMASTTELLASAREVLDKELERGISLANNKAQGEDYTLLYADAAGAMAECANEMGEVLKVTYDRATYVAWTVKRYENEVAGFCAEIAGAVSEIDVELEEALR